MCIRRSNSIFAIALVGLLAGAAHAQLMPMMPGNPVGPGGQVNLPYMTSDANGMWYVYTDGAIRQTPQMGQPVYQQGGMLTLDGNTFTTMTNQGVIDPKTGELILRNEQIDGLSVTRRILFDKADGYVRYIDLVHNPGNQPRTISVGLQSNLFWGVQQSKLIADPKHRDQNIAWAAMTPVGRSVLEVFGGPGAKLTPTINYQNGSNSIQAIISLNVPAGKDAAVMHLHAFVASLDAGAKFAADFDSAKTARTLPSAVRRAVENFDLGERWMEDMDILRGDLFDVVELRGGDLLKGSLQQDSYRLQTFYGPLDLPTAHVIAMLNVGAFGSRQLLVADDGEIFGGHLDKPTVDIALTSGQVVSIPLSQVSRVGRRKLGDEPDEPTFDKAMVLMRGGDRVEVYPPADKIEVATRYGLLQLDPSTIASIVFQTEDSPIPQIELTDGSKFVGLLSAEQLAMRLGGVGPDETVQFPVNGMVRLQLLAKTPEPAADAPSLQLLNGDVLAGSLTGDLKLQTSFDTIALNAGQIRRIERTSADNNSSPDQMQITLWDGSTMSGEIADASAQCQLLSGAVLNVPIPQLSEYNQPHPQPSADMVKQVEAAAADLSADDWRQRDRAQETLESMGPSIIGVLRDLRAKQSVEGQQRIDAIVKKLQSQPGAGGELYDGTEDFNNHATVPFIRR
jgi:hypothetical protein